MTTYTLNPAKLDELKGKTVLLFGGVTGIGRAALDILVASGANVALADWNDIQGSELVTQLSGHNKLFRKCDVSNFDDVLEVFQAARTKFGNIHAVISNAGVNTNEGFLEDRYDKDTGKLMAPDLRSLEINLVGQIYVVKCALHYFAKWPETQCQIVLTASAASFFPAPPIHMYSAAKSGVLGLMRAIRSDMIEKNSTINIVAPWLTVTPMLRDDWLEAWGDLPRNSSGGVAKALVLPLLKPDINGKAFFVAGDKIVEFEDTIHRAQPIWMGEELSEAVDKGQKFLLAANKNARMV